ncbi:MAG: hypothetical protein MZV70_52875 [Desulfobacterales bacterium]|nr:hypothetical protein [Desulfobacterales bacterium]
MIVVDNLSKSYGKQGLFDAVSFKVNRKERRRRRRPQRPRQDDPVPDDHRRGGARRRARSPSPASTASATSSSRLALHRARPSWPRAPRPCPHDAHGEIWRVEKVLAGPGLRGGRPGEAARRALGRLPGPAQPGQGPGRRLPDAPPRRAEQLPRHHLHPLAGAVPGGLAGRAPAHHPRPQLHGQRRHPRPGHPPAQGPQDRGRHRASTTSRSRPRRRSTRRPGSTTSGR